MVASIERLVSRSVPLRRDFSPMIFATLDECISAAGISKERKEPLFRTTRGRRRLTGNPLLQSEIWRMIRRRAATAGIKTEIGCHTFRAGMTAYLKNRRSAGDCPADRRP
jgi:integrase